MLRPTWPRRISCASGPVNTCFHSWPSRGTAALGAGSRLTVPSRLDHRRELGAEGQAGPAASRPATLTTPGCCAAGYEGAWDLTGCRGHPWNRRHGLAEVARWAASVPLRPADSPHRPEVIHPGRGVWARGGPASPRCAPLSVG